MPKVISIKLHVARGFMTEHFPFFWVGSSVDAFGCFLSAIVASSSEIVSPAKDMGRLGFVVFWKNFTKAVNERAGLNLRSERGRGERDAR